MTNNRTTEAEFGIAVLEILANSNDGQLTTQELRGFMPDYVNLTDADHSLSITREGEELWEQLVRNIVSHHATEGNIIAEGFATNPAKGVLKITNAGRSYLGNQGS